MKIFETKNARRIMTLKKQLVAKEKRIKYLENLCAIKDAYFMEVISDGMRHGSSLAASHMADRKKYINR